MDGNIVDQVKRIEAEADAIVSRARELAERLSGSLPSEVEAIRARWEDDVKKRLAHLKGELERRKGEKMAELEENAAGATRQLESLDPDALERAVQTILAHLREGGSWA